MIRYPDSESAATTSSPGTVSNATNGGYRYYKFVAPGSISIPS
jgi:hypothetical protein